MNSRYEIIPDLYIGTNLSAQNGFINNLCKIVVFINVEKDMKEFIGIHKSYLNEDMRKNIQKYEVEKILEYFNKTADNIYTSLNNEKGVLLHCNNCIQFSPSLAITYLIKYGKMTLEEAITTIKMKHNQVFIPDIKYKYLLELFNNHYS